MDAIIVAILTIFGAVISAVITILVKNYKDRKIKRVNPTFIIGNDKVEDIDLKLKNINDYWIYDLNNVDELVNKEHYYFYFSVLKNYYLFDCKITYQVTFTDDTKLPEKPKDYAIGTLFPHKGYMLPIEKTGRESSIEIILKFRNENNENIQFILVAEIDSNKKWFKTVTETSYRVKGNDEKNERLKEITCFSRNMSNLNSAKS